MCSQVKINIDVGFIFNFSLFFVSLKHERANQIKVRTKSQNFVHLLNIYMDEKQSVIRITYWHVSNIIICARVNIVMNYSG